MLLLRFAAIFEQAVKHHHACAAAHRAPRPDLAISSPAAGLGARARRRHIRWARSARSSPSRRSPPRRCSGVVLSPSTADIELSPPAQDGRNASASQSRACAEASSASAGASSSVQVAQSPPGRSFCLVSKMRYGVRRVKRSRGRKCCLAQPVPCSLTFLCSAMHCARHPGENGDFGGRALVFAR